MVRRLIAILGIALAVATSVPLVWGQQVDGPSYPGEIATAPDVETPGMPLLPGNADAGVNAALPGANAVEGVVPLPPDARDPGPIATPVDDRPAMNPNGADTPVPDGAAPDLPPAMAQPPPQEPDPISTRSQPLRVKADGPPNDGDVQQTQAASDAPSTPPSDRFPMGSHAVGLTIEMQAPTTANLNKEYKYRISVRNTGTGDAYGVVASDALPQGLTFVSSKPEPSSPPPGLSWKKDLLSSGETWQIDVTVKPEQVELFEHAATVIVTGGSRTRTQVKQPRLKVEQRLATSRELKGHQVEFKINVTNTGDGPARSVMVQVRLSKGLRHEKGQVLELPFKDVLGKASLNPGETVPLDLIVDTVEGGKQECVIEATSPDVVEPAVSTQSIEVIEPQLSLAFSKASTRRVPDTIASYTLTIENPGSAPTRDVKLAAFLPLGVRLEETDGGRYNAEKRTILWTFSQLEPGEKKDVTFLLRMGGPNIYPINAAAIAKDCTRLDKGTQTEVVGTADVDFTITERRRSLDVNDETVFEVRITNRGTKEATNLLISAILSDDMKWVNTSGTETSATDPKDSGHNLLFPKIPTLAAGGKLELTIKVQALKPGFATCQVLLMHDELGEFKIDHKQHIRIVDPAETRN
ncbi:MAG: hypothetical protein ABI353_18905 [Isosphaeraceae bacterium]